MGEGELSRGDGREVLGMRCAKIRGERFQSLVYFEDRAAN